MFRLSLFAFALLGFAFGSSKQGRELREKAGSMLTDMVSDSKEKIEQAKGELGKPKTIVMHRASADGAKEKEVPNGKNGHSQESGNAKAISQPAEKESQPSQEEQAVKKEGQEVKKSNDTQQPEAMAEQPALDVEKAQELADKLGAKPVAPEDENLKPFHNHDDEARKSA
jgi:hypothetical protein